MSDPVGEAAGGQFHFHPDTYPAMVRAAVPDFDELQDTVAGCVPPDGTVGRILELGTGSGETARRVLARHPHAALVGVDASEPMLTEARKILDAQRVRLVVARLQDALPPGPFDVVCSALAVHHLDPAEKRDLFARVLGVLRPGGRFVLGDVVVPGHGDGATTPVAAAHDKPDSVADQVGWLAGAGFAARCVWSRRDLAVVVADAPDR